MKVLYEVLVPTMYGYPEVRPIRTAHHKNWDKEVIKITGGMTLMKPAQGRWVDEGVEYPERVIPVRVMCEEEEVCMPDGTVFDHKTSQIDKIIKFTLAHYRQRAVMYYVVSREVNTVYASKTFNPRS